MDIPWWKSLIFCPWLSIPMCGLRQVHLTTGHTTVSVKVKTCETHVKTVGFKTGSYDSYDGWQSHSDIPSSHGMFLYEKPSILYLHDYWNLHMQNVTGRTVEALIWHWPFKPLEYVRPNMWMTGKHQWIEFDPDQSTRVDSQSIIDRIVFGS